MVCCNIIHIAPWAAAEGLFAGAGRYLKPGGGLYLYGPFTRDGRHTAPSNAAFDTSLRAQDPAWGARALDPVAPRAAAASLAPPPPHTLPATQQSRGFRKHLPGVNWTRPFPT